MSQDAKGAWLAGVDGCKAGWIVVFARRVGEGMRVRIVPRFADVLAAPEAPVVIAIDIPVGLPERAGYGGRAAENAVRPLLGARQSSVFSVPSRATTKPWRRIGSWSIRVMTSFAATWPEPSWAAEQPY